MTKAPLSELTLLDLHHPRGYLCDSLTDSELHGVTTHTRPAREWLCVLILKQSGSLSLIYPARGRGDVPLAGSVSLYKCHQAKPV